MTMPRLAAALAAACLLPSSPLGAAEVAVLKSTETPAWRPALDAMRRVAVGHNLTEYDLRGDRTEGEKVLATFKGKPFIVVAMGPLAAQLVKDLAPETAMVYCMVQDPAKAGLLALPNAAGVAYAIPVKNQLAAFRMVYPRGVRVGVIYSEEGSGRLVQEAQKASVVVRLVVVPRPVTSEKEVPQALRTLLKGDDAADALWMPPDPLLLATGTRRFLFAETLKAGKPVLSFSPALVVEGALASSGADTVSIGEQVGELVTRFAAGEKGLRGTLLVPRAELMINKKIADKLRIEIPADALRAAARVF
jgi:putative ABC transport system substrate-binding protein